MHTISQLKNIASQVKWLVFVCAISLLSACGSDSKEPDPRTIDTEPPVITLNGDDHLEVVVGRPYLESGASAIDNIDVEVDVTITGDMDINTLGNYILEYSATDTAGNTATITRTITVREALPFITTWKTDNPGLSNDDQISIRTTTEDQSYTIDWGDGTQDTGVVAGITHTYASPGTYTVIISGDFRNIKFDFSEGYYTDHHKLLSIEQWGDIQWSTMKQAFRGCSNLVLNATDLPDLSAVTDMSYMFAFARAFNEDISQWDVSAVTSMRGMFSETDTFNGGISKWDVSSVTDMSRMFYQATAFNGDISKWDVSSVTDMGSMFMYASSFNGDLSQWDVSSVTDMSNMFYSATLSTQNYDALLQGWSTKAVQSNVIFDGGYSQYSPASQSARDILVNIDDWTITDGGLGSL